MTMIDKRPITLTIPARRYIDCDDCLTAAADSTAARYGLEGWDLDARWADEDRTAILVTVPAWAILEMGEDLPSEYADEEVAS